MNKTHHIIIVPGLGDDVSVTQFWINRWPKTEDLSFEVWSAHWENYEDNFIQKYSRLLKIVKERKKEHQQVSLMGISAGASLVCNVFAKNPTLVHKVVNVCGRLQMKKSRTPTLEVITFRNLAYINSVNEFEKNEKKLDESEKKRIMTLSGMYDELVPISTIYLEGSKNKYIPFIGHNFCITLALTFFRSQIINFLVNKLESNT
jgi:predicted esterase